MRGSAARNAMERFLAERYLAAQDAESLAVDAERVREAARRAGACLIQTVYVPEDELCFYLFDSESAELVHGAGEFDRVVRVLPPAS
jgi:ribonuclease D